LSFFKLPINLKERVRSRLSPEEVLHLESGSEAIIEKSSKESLFAATSSIKLPVFQPTAAAAMMYAASMQVANQKRIDNEQPSRNNSSSLSLNDVENYTSLTMKNNNVDFENSTVSAKLLAEVLKKDSDISSKKKLFPYICLRCKKEMIVCESTSQTNLDDLNDPENRVACGNSNAFTPFPVNYTGEHMTRSKTVGNKLFEVSDMELTSENNLLAARNNHQKCSSVDWSTMNKSSLTAPSMKASSSNNGSRNRLNHNAWSDIQHI
jgi:hypothetical protein